MLELDPQIAKIIAADPPATLSAGTLAEMRASSAKPPAQPRGGIERRDHVVAGEPDVVIRVHRPAGPALLCRASTPCTAAEYVTGSYAIDDARLEDWSLTYQCAGMSVEYRLAPETPYPGPFEDCYRGLKWVFDHHEELGVDPGRIGVSGTSAGAGLAAGLAMLARDRGEVPLQFQLLDAPMIDDRQVTPSSLARRSGHLRPPLQRIRLALLSRRPVRHSARPRLCGPGPGHRPERASPAYVCVGNVDGFRDEAIDYATRLNQAGVPGRVARAPWCPARRQEVRRRTRWPSVTRGGSTTGSAASSWTSRDSRRRQPPGSTGILAANSRPARPPGVWSAMQAFVAANDRRREMQEALDLGRGLGRVKLLVQLTGARGPCGSSPRRTVSTPPTPL